MELWRLGCVMREKGRWGWGLLAVWSAGDKKADAGISVKRKFMWYCGVEIGKNKRCGIQ